VRLSFKYRFSGSLGVFGKCIKEPTRTVNVETQARSRLAGTHAL
jgi:hypothetical protein